MVLIYQILRLNIKIPNEENEYQSPISQRIFTYFKAMLGSEDEIINIKNQDAIRTMKAYPIASTMAKFETYDFGTDDCSFEVEWKGIHAII